MQKRKNTILIIMFTLLLAGGTNSCGLKRQSTEKQKKEFLDLQENRDKELAKKTEEDKKKHVEVQTKETQKRMKKNKKKMERMQKGKQPRNFFQRLFTKKPH